MSDEILNENNPTEVRDDLGFGSDAPEVANKNLTGLIKSRGYGELSLDPTGPDTGALKYAKGDLSKTDALRLLQNPEFIQDVYDFFQDRDGITFSSPQEAIEEFYSDRGWKSMNFTSMAKEAWYTTGGSATDAQKARLSRLQRVYDALPNFYEDGGTGAAGLAANVGKAVFDPVNLIGMGVGGMAAKGGAIAAKQTGKNLLVGAIKEGGKSGAKVEAVLGGGIEAGYNAAEQFRDIGIGERDEYSFKEGAFAAGVGGVAGGALGGLFGAAGGALFRRNLTRTADGKYDFKQSFVEKDKEVQNALKAQEEANFTEAVENFETNPTPENKTVIQNLIDQNVRPQLERIYKGLLDEFEASDRTKFDNLMSGNKGGRTDDEVFSAAEFPDVSPQVINEAKKLRKVLDNIYVTRNAIEEADALDIQTQKLRDELPSKKDPAEIQQTQTKIKENEAASLQKRKLVGAFLRDYKDGNEQGLIDKLLQLNDIQARIDAEDNLVIGKPEEATPKTKAEQDILETEPKVEGDDVKEVEVKTETAEEIQSTLSDLEKRKKLLQRQQTYRNQQAKAGKELSEKHAKKAETYEQDLKDVTDQIKDANAKLETLNNNKTVEADEALSSEQAKVREQELTEAKARQEGRTAEAEEAVSTPDEGAPDAPKPDLKPEPVTIGQRMDQINDLLESDPKFNPNKPDIIDTDKGSIKFIEEIFDPADIKAAAASFRREVKDLVDNQKYSRKQARLIALQNMIDDYIGTEGVNAIAKSLSDPADTFALRGIYNRDAFMGIVNNDPTISDDSRKLIIDAYEKVINDETNAAALFESTVADMPNAPIEQVLETIARHNPEGIGPITKLLFSEKPTARKSTIKPDVNKILSGLDVSDFTDLEKAAIQKTAALFIEGLSNAQPGRSYNDEFIKKIVQLQIDKVRNRRLLGDKVFDVKAEKGAGGDIDITASTSVSLGKDRNGRIQNLLRKANRYGLTDGPLLEQYKKKGQVYTGTAAAEEALLDAKLDSRSETGREEADFEKFAYIDANTGLKTKRKTSKVDGKRVENATYGFEADKVVVIDKALTQIESSIRSLDKGGDAYITANELYQMSRDILKVANITFVPPRGRANELLTIDVKDVTSTPEGFKEFPGNSDGTKSWVYKLVSDTDIHNKVQKSGKELVDGKYEKISNLTYERIEAPEGTAGIGDAVTGKVYQSKSDIPADNVTDTTATYKQVRQALKDLRKRFTHSTPKEKAGNENLVYKSGKNYNIALAQRDLRAINKSLSELRNQAESPLVKLQIKGLLNDKKRIKAQIKDLGGDPRAKTLNRKALANIKKAHMEGVAEDKAIAKQKIEEYTGKPLDEVDEEIAQEIVDQDVNAEAIQLKMKEELNELVSELTSGQISKEDYDLGVSSIVNRMIQLGKESPDTKPVGRNKPDVIDFKGYEVDVNNHFKIKNIDGIADAQNIFFLGKRIGRIMKRGDVYEVHSNELDTVHRFASSDFAKRSLPEMFEIQVLQAGKSGKLATSNLTDTGSTKNFRRKDHTKTNTYENAAEEPQSNPVDDTVKPTEVEQNADPRLNTFLSQYLPKVPKGRALSIYLETGEYANTIRTPSQKQLDGSSVFDVLKKQSKENYIIGTVDANADGALAKLESFEPMTDIGQAFRVVDKTPKQKQITNTKGDISMEPGAVGLQRASNVKLEDKLIPNDAEFKSRHKTVGDVLTSIEILEQTPWSKLKSKGDVQAVIRQLDLLNGIVERHIPRGIKLPNRSRETSWQKFATIMSTANVNQGDINAVLMVMSRMAGTELDAASPNFAIVKGEQMRGAYFGPGSGPNDGSMQNIIGLDLNNINANGLPPSITVLHELGHWAYNNILDASHKKQFWNTIGKYVTDDGVDLGALKARLPGDPHIGNELSSPSEFFAQQFVQYAIAKNKAGTYDEVMSMWKRIGRTVNETIRRWFGVGGDEATPATHLSAIDPDLIPLFQRIFPDRDPVNRYANLLSKFANADQKTKYRLSVLMDLDEVRSKIDKALDGSHEELLSALGGRGLETDRPSAATVLNSFLRNARGRDKVTKRFGNPTRSRKGKHNRKRFFEEGELVDIDGSVPRHRNQSDYHTFTKITDAYWKIINHAKKMRDPRFIDADKKAGKYSQATPGQYLGALEATAGKGERGAIDVANAREIQRLIKEQAADDGNYNVDAEDIMSMQLGTTDIQGGGNKSLTALVMENAAANQTPDNIDQLAVTRALAFDVLANIENAEKRLRRQLHNIFGEMDGFDITTSVGRDEQVYVKGAKNKSTKRFRSLNAKRKRDNVNRQLTGRIKQIEDLEKQADSIMKKTLGKQGQSSTLKQSPKEMSIREIADETKVSKKQTARTKDLTAELVQKLLSDPEVPEFSVIQRSIEADPNITRLSNGRVATTPGDFVQLLQEGYNQGYQARMDYAMYVLRGQPDGLNLMPRKAPVKRMVMKEVEQSKGVSGENGIPARTPVYIKEFLRKVTHRDPLVENNARTFTYRLLNILGKTQFDKNASNNFLTMDDVGGLFPESYFGANYGTFEHANNGEVLNIVRRTARKIAQNLKSGKSKIEYPNTIASRKPVGREYTVIDEVGYLMYHSAIDEEGKININNAYQEALELGEARAVKISESFNVPNPKGAAVKWFIDGFNDILSQKTTKRELYNNLSGSALLEDSLDSVTEHSAYLLNKMIGNKKLRQRYRYLTYFGDMHYDAASVHPIKRSVDQTGNSGTLHLAKKYASETISSFSDAADLSHREFLNARSTDNLLDYVFYHGTPNGDAFNKYKGARGPKPSNADSLYGPGVYLAKDPTASETYARFTHKNSLKAMVDSDDPDVIAITDEIINDIMENNYKLNDISRAYAGRDIRKTTLNRMDEMEAGIVEPVDGDPAYTMLQDAQVYERLMLKNEELFERLGQFTKVRRNPKVVPMFVRADNMFDFSDNATYSVGSGEPNDIGFFMKELQTTGLFKDQEMTRMLNEFRLQGELDGSDFYQNLVDTLTTSGRSEAEAKTLITRAFNQLGYDGFLITEPHPVTNDVVDAIVIHNNKSLRTVDADVEDSVVNPEFASNMNDKHQSLNGQLLQDVVELNKKLEDSDYVNIGSKAQKLGMPDALQGFVKKTLRKEAIDIDDVEVIEKNYSTNFISENSAHLRKIGAAWLGNLIKPKDGPGIYQMHAADLAKRIQPVMQMLQKLPDYGNPVKRYISKTAPFFQAIPLLGRAVPEKAVAPPASHKRIIRAMRAGDISNLNDAEKQIANHLVGLFKTELNDLHNLGIPVGDVTLRNGTKYYVPQIWNADIVRENPKAFVESLQRFITREKRMEGKNVDPREIAEIASNMMNRIIDTDGRIDVDVDARTSGITSDPFYQRFITLNKDTYPEFADYLVDDLEGIITKYFDKTTRKKLMAKNFGAGGHGLNAYTVTAKLGVEGAADILSENKLITMPRSTGDDVLEVSHIVIPTPNQIERAHLKEILRDIQASLINTNTNTVHARVDAARRRLLALTDTGSLNPGQMANLKIRIDAVVNGLKDFPGGMSEGSEGFIRSINDVLERRPMSDSRMLNNVSKKMRAFNSVSLLGWTTLTSIPDMALPLIRTGNFKGWMKAWKDVTLGSPEYRQAAKDIGVGVENLIHDRMTHMAGDGSQQFQHAFFYGTGLQSWTNFMREVSAVVGYNTFKAEADMAQKLIAKGQIDSAAYRKSLRLLKRYGLEAYAMPGSRRMADMKTVAKDDNFRYATMRFVNETIFTPDPNDVPLWAQHPIGSMVFQLKSFPLMMMRMVFGEGGVVDEAWKYKNFKPMIALLTVGGGFGMMANTIKDYTLQRGGEDGREAALRERKFSKTAVGETFKVFTGVEGEDADRWLQQNLGKDADKFLGHYLEGIVALGGLGLLAELFFNTAAQADNRYYGAARMMSAIGGPSTGVLFDAAANVGGGIELARESIPGVEGDGSNSSERAFIRTLLRRIPVAGGNKVFTEGGTDLLAGEQTGRRSQSEGGNVFDAMKASDFDKLFAKFK